ncbi:hypothetical protein J4471_02570 [Candidatus Woesearchaeota archaeon]|nr:hypothetical protein [Candidatus Woesearchaeota archaeon]
MEIMVKNKVIGFTLICVAIIFLVAVIIFKLQINNLTNSLMEESGGTCISEGKCLHEQSDLPVFIGVAVVFLTLALGIYLLLFEKTKEKAEKIQKEIVNTLKETKKKQDYNEKFEFLLKALNEDEKNIMKALKEQDGIEQATLRIRTNMSKTKLSMVLSELERKSLVKKVAEGKKNRIYLKNAF